MLHCFILKGSFQDSVTLMVLSRDLSALPGVVKASVMMGTPANKDVFRETGLWHDTLDEATPSDVCVIVDCEDAARAAGVLEELKTRLADVAKSRRASGYPVARSWRRARQLVPDAKVALISVAGHYAADVARQALDDGCHVMMFSDNVPVEAEVELKLAARRRGLIVMGPDCGTSVIGGVPLAFANRMPKGPIAVIGASGTGIQEICSQIAARGAGITHAIGLGGRDLSAAVGGISALTAIDFVAADAASRVVVFVSKPPAPEVKARVLAALKLMQRPVVALFLGDRQAARRDGNVHFAQTLDGASALAVDLANVDSQASHQPSAAGLGICGLYTGGTLAAEAAQLLADALGLHADETHAEGYMLRSGGHRVIDLGDDLYTRGRPHPMIDPTLRNEMIRALADEPTYGVLLLDVVLGYGANADPAGVTARAVAEMRAARGGAPITVIATLTGTDQDPQDRASQAAKLEEAGIVIAESTRTAVELALRLVQPPVAGIGAPPPLLAAPPAIVNIGLRGFADELQAGGTNVVHYLWEPIAGGNQRLQRLVAALQ